MISVQRFQRYLRNSITILIVLSWLFSDWPPLLPNWSVHPKIQTADAITLSDTLYSSGSWFAPTSVTSVTVEAWGGGGGGAGEAANTQYGMGAGGGGAYSKKSGITVIPGNSYSVTVGTAGAAANGAGGDGGDSYFIDTSTVLAKGGKGASGATHGAGGLASAGVGDTTYDGGDGGDGGTPTIGSGGGGGGAGDGAVGGAGGSGSGSPTAGTAGTGGATGGGNGGAGLAAEANGNPGSIPGGGGGGAYIPDATNHSGGAGGGGMVKITYVVNYEAPTLVGVGPQTSGTTSPLSATLPSGIQQGDLMLLVIIGRPSGTAGTADAISPPGGWTQRGTRTRQEIGTIDLSVDVFYKIAGASESDPSITAGTAFTGGTTEGWSVQTAVYTNVDTSNPFDLTSPSTAGSAAAATLAPPTITTNSDYALAFSIVGSADDNALAQDSGNQQNFTAQMFGASYDTTDGSDHAMGMSDRVKIAAGDVTMPTWRETAVGNDAWVYFSDALKSSVPDHTWVTGAANYEIWQSGSLTWNAGTLICSGTLNDSNASTISCTSDPIAASTQYRIQVTLKNGGTTGGITKFRTADDFVDQVGVKGGWTGTNPTLGTCGYNDIGSDDEASTDCTLAWNNTNDVRLTNISNNGVIIAAGETEGFMYLVTTDADAVTNATSYMNTSIDGITEDSSMISITGPFMGSLGFYASTSLSFDSPLSVLFTSQTSTASAVGSINVVDTRGTNAGWTLSVACSRWKVEDGTPSLRCHGDGTNDNTGKLCVFPNNANLYAESGSLTGVTKGSNQCFGPSISDITIVTATSGHGNGSYWLTDRSAEQFIPANPTSAVYTSTITYTLN